MRKILELIVHSLLFRLLVTGLVAGIPMAITTGWLGAAYLNALQQADFLSTFLGLLLSGVPATVVIGVFIAYAFERWIIRDRALTSWRWIVVRFIGFMLIGIPEGFASFVSISVLMGRFPPLVESVYFLQTMILSVVIGLLYTLIERAVEEVKKRESQYKKQIEALNTQIDILKRDQQVKEVVDSEYFQRVKIRASELRNRNKAESTLSKS
jgi:hypothetical protein